MGKKRFVSIIVISGVIILVGVMGYIIVNKQVFLPIPISSPTPTPNSSPTSKSSPTLTPTPKPNSMSYMEDGTCPPGYVNYGVPLQCVTPEYMESCKNHPCPICLSEKTRIDTPSGSVFVKDLQIGMPIWTINKAGQRVAGVVNETSKVSVPPTHQMVHLILEDGRELLVSPGHPTIDGNIVGNLISGGLYDGALIASVKRVPYGESATYDILPSGGTGFYWANGILLDSTLH